jgi:hypothetical protein
MKNTVLALFALSAIAPIGTALATPPQFSGKDLTRTAARDPLGDSTARYLRQHPRERHRPANTLVVKAVQLVFPCSRTTAKKR